MVDFYSQEMDKVLNSTPAEFADGAFVGGRVRRYRATITLAAQASGQVATIARVPDGAVFAYGVLNTDTSLGTSTIKIGDATDDDLYRSAATFTATNTPTMFGRNLGLQEGKIDGQKEIILTVGTAALPASGNLFVDLYFTQA